MNRPCSLIARLITACTEENTRLTDDEAYFRRVRIVPFDRFFEPHERDKGLHTALKAEADGIMRWLVEGYQLYGKEGL